MSQSSADLRIIELKEQLANIRRGLDLRIEATKADCLEKADVVKHAAERVIHRIQKGNGWPNELGELHGAGSALDVACARLAQLQKLKSEQA